MYDSFNARIANMGRGSKIQFPFAQVDNLLACGFQYPYLSEMAAVGEGRTDRIRRAI